MDTLQVRVDIESLFYAIEHTYLEIVKRILKHDSCIKNAVSRYSEDLQGLFEVSCMICFQKKKVAYNAS